MSNKCSGFVVRCFKRDSGNPGWLVSGTIAGRQIRREFSSREDAQSFAEEQNSRLHGRQPDQVTRLTRLSLPELRDAESVCERLNERFPGVSLQDVFRHYETIATSIPPDKAPELAAAALRLKEKFPDVSVARATDHFTTNYRPPKTSVTLEVGLENYLSDMHRRELSPRQEESILHEMGRLEKHFGKDRLISSIDDIDLADYLRRSAEEGGKPYSNKTWNNRRGYLTGLWKYFVRNERWLDDNVASRVIVYKKKELAKGKITIIPAQKARELMQYLENHYDGRMVPYFALCLFAGIRPDWEDGEISRLNPKRIDFDEGTLVLGESDTKTGFGRLIRMQPNLIAWLRSYPLSEYPIKAVNFKKLRLKIRQKFDIRHDTLRHTFCSMQVGKFRSLGDTALQAGNSERIIMSHYLSLVSKTEAEEFWGIMPTKPPAPGSPPQADGAK